MYFHNFAQLLTLLALAIIYPVARAQTIDPSPAPPTATGPDNTGKSSTGIGDFIFDTPVPTNSKVFISAGDSYRIVWHTQPSTLADPGTITLQYRYGVYPNVQKFVVIADTIANLGYYDWPVPTTVYPGSYIFQISTSQLAPQIRNRTSQLVTIYTPMTPANGSFYYNDVSRSELSWVLMACGILGLFVFMRTL